MVTDTGTIRAIANWLGTGSINIFGVPFAGKDTQGRKLAELLDAPLIGGGDIIRNNPHVPQYVKATIAKGLLADREDYLKIVIPYLSKPGFKGRPLVLSAVGRWSGEEEVILKAAAEASHPIKAVIFLNISQAVARQRWEKSQRTDDRGKRLDDQAEHVSTRLDEFRNKTLPVIEFYRQKGLLIELDGSGQADEIAGEIIEKLYQKANQISDNP
jgi:adenylate kinase